MCRTVLAWLVVLELRDVDGLAVEDGALAHASSRCFRSPCATVAQNHLEAV